MQFPAPQHLARISFCIFALTIAGALLRSQIVSAQTAGDSEGPTKDLLHPTPSGSPSTHPSGLTYSLSDGSAKWDADARARIIKAMDAAVTVYNANGEFNRHVIANFNPGTPTADANFGGWINFGGQIGTRTALHELAHTLGVGTCQQWQRLAKDGKWTGAYAIQQLKEIDGPDAVLHCDHQHFWPYGLNYDREGGEENFKHHVKMVIALRADMGLGPPPGISEAALKSARTDALAAHVEVDRDQKALDALPSTLQKNRDQQPDVIDAKRNVAAAKSNYDAAVTATVNALGDDHDYQAAKSAAASAHLRLDKLRADGAADPPSPDFIDAAKAVMASDSSVAALKATALAANPRAVDATKAYDSAKQSLDLARAATRKDDKSQLDAANTALKAAKEKADADDQTVIQIQDALAKEKHLHAN